jgi:hypothetical protein
MIIIYLSGAISGEPDLGKPLFDSVANELRAAGHTVCNPHDFDREHGVKSSDAVFGGSNNMLRRQVLLRDCAFICNEAQMVVALSSWKRSRGSRMEIALAKAIGIPVRYLREKRSKRNHKRVLKPIAVSAHV